MRMRATHHNQQRPLTAHHTTQLLHLQHLHQSQQQQLRQQKRLNQQSPPPRNLREPTGRPSSRQLKCSKLSKMSLSCFGRAFGAAGYAISTLRFHAEFASMPTQVAAQLLASTTKLSHTAVTSHFGCKQPEPYSPPAVTLTLPSSSSHTTPHINHPLHQRSRGQLPTWLKPFVTLAPLIPYDLHIAHSSG